MTRMPPKIGLLDHVGGGNLGDDATQEAVIQNIRRRWPEVEIYGFSMNPADTESRHGIRSYPIRRNTWSLGPCAEIVVPSLKGRVKLAALRYRRLFQVLRSVNALLVRMPKAICSELRFLATSLRTIGSFQTLIISGGGQLTESWGGPWKFPYTIFKWVLIAKLNHVEPIVLNVGAGPLTMPLSKYFVRTALSLADYVSFRDAKSARLAEEIGFHGEKAVFPDLVYSLTPPLPAANRPEVVSRRSIVGFAPMPWGKSDLYPDENPMVYRSLLTAMVGLGSWLIANQYQVDLFSTDLGVDPPAIADLERTMRDASQDNAEHVRIAEMKGTADLLGAMSTMEYVVTCRFHGVVFAHILNIPVIALSHHTKVSTLMADIGLQDYCLDLRTVDANKLIDTFSSLVANTPEIKKRMEETRSVYQARLASQFDKLFAKDSASVGNLTGRRLPRTRVTRPDGASAR